MKKFVTFILLVCMILTLAACADHESTTPEITMQDIYDANQIETLLNKHQSVSIREAMDGEFFSESYRTQKYSYVHYPDDEYEFAHYMTDDTSYAYNSGEYVRYLYIDSDGVTNDFASDHAELCVPVLDTEILNETIESVSEKDSRITVRSYLDQEFLADEEDLNACKNEYVLDAETYELISVIRDFTYEDGTAFRVVKDVTYDAEEPEMLEVFLQYANQTEDLRNITVVSNPGAEKEVSQDFRIPKGLILGFTFGDAFADKIEFYTDAACTEAYDPYADTESDLTVYVKYN